MERVLFAFSGGIDDVLGVHWLSRTQGHPVVALLADLGQAERIEPLGELALESGAQSTIIVDLRRSFVEDFAFPTLRSGARYEDYLLSTPLARYAIAQELVRLAGEQGITVVGHGSSGGGNDQLRFESSVAALDPSLEIVAPGRRMPPLDLDQKMERLRRLHLPEREEFERRISVDQNLWGCGQVHGGLADPWESPPEETYLITRSPLDAPNEPLDVVIEFEEGSPVSVDGTRLSSVDLVLDLHEKGVEHGIGRLDHVENRVLGGKARELYEAPAAQLLYTAHGALEELTQPQDLLRLKRNLADEYGRLIYEGQWFGELREALDHFFRATQRYVSGRIRLRLYKGGITVRGRESRYALYDREGGEVADRSRREAAVGFVDSITRQLKAEATRRRAE